MIPLIESRREAVAAVAERHRVRSLFVFGSATRADFEPGVSDVDLLVEFLPLTPAEYVKEYFELQEELEALLGVHVDLVERKPIRNEVFLEAVERSKMLLYEAA